jgi:recombination protein RecR
MPEALQNLIRSISYLPGIWDKSASKLAFFLLNSNTHYLQSLSEDITSIKSKVSSCETCHSLTDLWQSLCVICKNPRRNHHIIAVVEEYLDMLTLEQSWSFDWCYHVLWWAISPINGVFIWDLQFPSLLKRIQQAPEPIELIIATNPNIEWEATTSYITEEITKQKLKHKVTITRLSRWLSSWYIEYADNITLANALKERKEI